MKGEIKIVKVCGLILGISLILFLVIRIGQALHIAITQSDVDLESTYMLTTEDSALINPNYLSRIKILENRNSSTSPHIAQLIVDNKYPLIIYRIDANNDLLFPDFIQITKASVSQTTMVDYKTINYGSNYDISFKGSNTKNISSLSLSFATDSVEKIIVSDSIINYFSDCNNMSIKYNDEDTTSIYIDAPEKIYKKSSVLISVLFLKKGTNTYLFALLDHGNEIDFPKKLLLSIVSK
jgi:hypothetical protein